MNNNWIFDGKHFFHEINIILQDENVFKNFKNRPVFNTIINNDCRSFEYILPFMESIRSNHPEFLQNLKDSKYRTLDDIGAPKIIKSLGVSSGVIIFLYVLSDIIKHFGDITSYDIIEIGSGYGGQCKIISDHGCKSYTCVDVEPTISLTKRYLSFYNYKNIEFIDYKEITNSKKINDLVISNWCLSEMDNDGIDFYCEYVISKSNGGFFWSNLWDENRKEFLLYKLRQIFKHVEIHPYLLSDFPNYLIVCKK